MRISDWSSDVCSSDLDAKDLYLGLRRGVADHQRRGFGARRRETRRRADRAYRLYGGADRRRCRKAGARQIHEPGGDRKSVVSGKSVSRRLDLGGRRIIKKQNKYVIIQSM